MSVYAFAHTWPVWIDRVGSTDPVVKVAEAQDLLRALDVADKVVEIKYPTAEHPKWLAHYAAAHRILDGWIGVPGR